MNKQEIIEKICELYETHQEHDWNGYGANPLIEINAYDSIRFVNSLEDKLLPNDVCPESTGNIGLEWRSDMGYITASVDKKYVTYGGMVNDIKKSGCFENSYMSDFLIEAINEIKGV